MTLVDAVNADLLPVLDPYQSDLVEKALAEVDAGGRRGIIQLATGAGKTEIGMTLLAAALNGEWGPCGWLTHRDELRKQTIRRLESAGLPVHNLTSGFSASNREIVDGAVNIISPAWRRMPEIYHALGLLILDEGHHSAARTWEQWCEDWPGPIIALTATPRRMSRHEGFDHIFEWLICGPTKEWLQDKNFLAREIYPKISTRFERESLKRVGGEYTPGSIEEQQTKLLRRPQVFQEWDRITADLDDRRTIWFCADIPAAEALAAYLRAQGEEASTLHSRHDNSLRDDVMWRFRDGELRHLVSVDALTEGIDVPACNVAAILRPTGSLVKWHQMVGRVTRPQQRGEVGGECYILDFAANCNEHGTADDPSIIWSLGESGEKPEGGNPFLATCYECDAVVFPAKRVCNNCLYDLWFQCGGCGIVKRWTNYDRDEDGPDPLAFKEECKSCIRIANLDEEIQGVLGDNEFDVETLEAIKYLPPISRPIWEAAHASVIRDGGLPKWKLSKRGNLYTRTEGGAWIQYSNLLTLYLDASSRRGATWSMKLPRNMKVDAIQDQCSRIIRFIAEAYADRFNVAAPSGDVDPFFGSLSVPSDEEIADLLEFFVYSSVGVGDNGALNGSVGWPQGQPTNGALPHKVSARLAELWANQEEIRGKLLAHYGSEFAAKVQIAKAVTGYVEEHHLNVRQ